jgi:hypothetical protein
MIFLFVLLFAVFPSSVKSRMRFLLVLLLMVLATSPAEAQLASLADSTTSSGFHFKAISSTDHTSNKTAVSSITCRRSKNGTDAACGGTAVEVSDANQPGMWFYTYAAGDVDTAGSVAFVITATGMDEFDKEISVGQKVKLSASAIDAAAYAARGTAQSVTSNTIQLASSEAYANDELNDNVAVAIVSASSGAGQVRCIRDYVGSTDTATVDAWTTTPTGTITYDLIQAPDCTIGSGGLSVSAANKVADTTLRRNTSNVEASSDGDTVSRKSLYGSVAKQTHKIDASGGVLKTYKADGTTVLSSQALTTQSGAAPINGVGD